MRITASICKVLVLSQLLLLVYLITSTTLCGRKALSFSVILTSPTPTSKRLENDDKLKPDKDDVHNPAPDIKLLNSSQHDVDIVIGIPSIRRPGNVVYVDETLSHLVSKRDESVKVLFLAYLAELDQEWVSNMTNLIKSKFLEEMKKGIVKIITPPHNLYPDWSKDMKITLSDPQHQVKWRSKQNIDAGYLMKVAHSLNTKYYLGLEDDVTAFDGYLTEIFQHAESKWTDSIIFASYCSEGAIGKLFLGKDLPMISGYLNSFWNYKPLDWLYWDLKKLVACRYPATDCERDADAVVLEHKNLFSHNGEVSSLVKNKS